MTGRKVEDSGDVARLLVNGQSNPLNEFRRNVSVASISNHTSEFSFEVGCRSAGPTPLKVLGNGGSSIISEFAVKEVIKLVHRVITGHREH